MIGAAHWSFLSLFLQNDVSDRRLGNTLSQVVNGEERNVLNIRHNLPERETKYSISEDCLAMKWIVFTI